MNYHVVLKTRPGKNGEPENDNFGFEVCELPSSSLAENEVEVESLFLSIDPAQRCQMNEDTGAHYLDPWQINQTIIGLGGLGKVLKSNNPDFSESDIIQGALYWPWKRVFKVNVEEKKEVFQKIDPTLFSGHLSLSLSVMVGVTSLIGMRQVGHVKSGHTLVVSGAAGACGSIAGQIGLLDGSANVVGICGSQEKCDWLTGDLGFQHAINYKTDDVAERLLCTCPDGIDVYFENVGGEISDEVIKQMKPNCVVVLCGQISQYNRDVPYPPPLSPAVQDIVNKNNIHRDRYLVLNYKEMIPQATKEFLGLLLAGKIKYRETVTEGLEHTGEAFVSMMRGGNIGKQVVKL